MTQLDDMLAGAVKREMEAAIGQTKPAVLVTRGELADRLDAIDDKLEALAAEAELTRLAEAGQIVHNSLVLVETFHNAVGHPVEPVPCVPDDARVALRLDMLDEELGELRRKLTGVLDLRRTGAAIPPEAYVAIARELTDIQYVLDGTFLEFGLARVKSHLFNAVHMSNMTKLQADGTPLLREDGKVMKGPGYISPSAAIAEILTLALADAPPAAEGRA